MKKQEDPASFSASEYGELDNVADDATFDDEHSGEDNTASDERVDHEDDEEVGEVEGSYLGIFVML